jgi:hypothetical protein
LLTSPPPSGVTGTGAVVAAVLLLPEWESPESPEPLW